VIRILSQLVLGRLEFRKVVGETIGLRFSLRAVRGTLKLRQARFVGGMFCCYCKKSRKGGLSEASAGVYNLSPESNNAQNNGRNRSIMIDLGYWQPIVRCKTPDCTFGKPTFLPYPNLPKITEGLPEWPTDDWKPFLICKHCGHGYSYSKTDVEWGSNSNKNGLPENNSVLYIGLECAEKSCESPVEVYLGFDVAKTEKHRDKLLESGALSAVCVKGHSPAEPLAVVWSESAERIGK